MSTARNELLEKLKYNDVILVSGETGSGKTTQVGVSVITVKMRMWTGLSWQVFSTGSTIHSGRDDYDWNWRTLQHYLHPAPENCSKSMLCDDGTLQPLLQAISGACRV